MVSLKVYDRIFSIIYTTPYINPAINKPTIPTHRPAFNLPAAFPELVPLGAELVPVGVPVAVGVDELAFAVGETPAPRSGKFGTVTLLSVLLTLTREQSASYRYGLIKFGPVILSYANLTRESWLVLYLGHP